MNATQQRLHRQQPALVVKHGNAENKTLELDHDGLTLGRARGCDIELNAPEVSTIHCIISRTATGLYIRDCKSRAGTRLNGQRIYEAPLHDGDVLQIGPFSFEVQVPGVYLLAPARSSPEAAGQSRAAHLARSRRHLAELALGLRERLRAREAAAREQETSQSLNLRRVELDRQAEALRVRIRDFEQKFLQVEDAERHLAAARESMVRDQSAFRTHVQQVEQELEQRRIQAEVEIQKRRQELEDWYKEVEQGGVSLEHTSPDGLLFSEELQELERRRQELDRYAQHLLETEQRLQEQTETWQREKAQAQGKTPAPADETSSPPKPSLPPEENLEGLCADLAARIMTEFQQWYQRTPPSSSEQEHMPAELVLPVFPEEDLSEEIREEFQAEIAALHAQVQEKDDLIESLRRQQEAAHSLAAAEDEKQLVEMELTAFRRQLEEERRQLQEELRQVKAGKTELDEAFREAELELSRERAQLGHERAFINQLRADIRMELQKVQSDSVLRERLTALANRRLS